MNFLLAKLRWHFLVVEAGNDVVDCHGHHLSPGQRWKQDFWESNLSWGESENPLLTAEFIPFFTANEPF